MEVERTKKAASCSQVDRNLSGEARPGNARSGQSDHCTDVGAAVLIRQVGTK